MSFGLYTHAQALSLLEAARAAPDDDGPRLVLADWLADQGDSPRAELIRLQCRLAPSQPPLNREEAEVMHARCQDLLGRHGGAWLGPLWHYSPASVRWHRGLLSVKLPGRVDPASLADVLPWVDTAHFTVCGWRSLCRAAAFLSAASVNHATLDLKQPLTEERLLEGLSQVPESPCLRTLTFEWPLRLLRRVPIDEGPGARCLPAVTTDFLYRLLAECPPGKHLTHLGTTWPFADEQAQMVRRLAVEPAHARERLWMHSRHPACFRLARHRE